MRAKFTTSEGAQLFEDYGIASSPHPFRPSLTTCLRGLPLLLPLLRLRFWLGPHCVWCAGDNPNSIYLDHHGFMPKENPFECAYVRLNPPDMSHDAPLRYMRQKLMEILQVHAAASAWASQHPASQWPRPSFPRDLSRSIGDQHYFPWIVHPDPVEPRALCTQSHRPERHDLPLDEHGNYAQETSGGSSGQLKF